MCTPAPATGTCLYRAWLVRTRRGSPNEMRPAARPSAHPHPRLVVSIHSSSSGALHAGRGVIPPPRAGTRPPLIPPLNQDREVNGEDPPSRSTPAAAKSNLQASLGGWDPLSVEYASPASFAQPTAQELDLAQSPPQCRVIEVCNAPAVPGRCRLPFRLTRTLFLSHRVRPRCGARSACF
jgi:hypothetical protein